MKKKRIRSIVIGLFQRDGRILVNEAFDSVRGDRFARPLGGGLEFGEHSRDALIREIREEIGAEVNDLELVGVLENIFVYEGEPGHEVVFVYDGELRDKEIYERGEIEGFEEGMDTPFTARWHSPEELKNNNTRLVPEGLAQLIADRDRSRNS